MSKHQKENVGFIAMVVGGLIGLILYAAKLLIQTSILLFFFLFKRPISRALNLERLSTNWQNLYWLYLTAKCIAAWFFLQMIGKAVLQFKGSPLHTDRIMHGVLLVSVALACAFVFSIIHWIGQYARDPDVQKKMAGIAAEHYVQNVIEKNQQHFPLAQSLHGKLFVFNADMPNEFSVEADHIVITERNIFVIETKCKSGTISAGTDVPRWNVSSKHGDGEMQNALKQAKNAARVLHRQANLPCEIIPLVAIKGNDVQIIDGPSNVSAAENIIEIMRAFEQSEPNRTLDPTAIQALLQPYIRNDQTAMERHIERAQAAKKRADQAEIVAAASI